MTNRTSPTWESCRADLTACKPFATGNFNTGDAPPETVFRGSGGLITPLWKGTLRETAPPSVRGQIRGNEVVVPVAGDWTGGWASDYDALSLSICRTAAGEHCIEIDYESVRKPCGSEGTALIDPAFAGRYLRVVDRHYGSGTVFVGVGHSPYYPIGEIQPEATVSMAVVDKIASATGPATINCGPPPLIDASIAVDGSAEVACELIACRATLIAQRDGKTARVKRKIAATPLSRDKSGTATRFHLRPSVIDSLGGGTIKVSLKVNGTVVARRSVRAGSSER